MVRRVALDEAGGRSRLQHQLIRAGLLRVDPEDARELRQQRARSLGEPDRPLEPTDLGDGLGELGDGVVVDQPRAVGGLAARDELDPEQGLLAGLEKVRALPVERDRVAADLADRLGRAREELGVGVDEVVRAEHSPGLLVGEEGDDEVARGASTGAEDVA